MQVEGRARKMRGERKMPVEGRAEKRGGQKIIPECVSFHISNWDTNIPNQSPSYAPPFLSALSISKNFKDFP